MKNLNVEVWYSSSHLEERHFFLEDERNTYVFGYNPQLVDDESVRKILKIIQASPLKLKPVFPMT